MSTMVNTLVGFDVSVVGRVREFRHSLGQDWENIFLLDGMVHS